MEGFLGLHFLFVVQEQRELFDALLLVHVLILALLVLLELQLLLEYIIRKVLFSIHIERKLFIYY